MQNGESNHLRCPKSLSRTNVTRYMKKEGTENHPRRIPCSHPPHTPSAATLESRFQMKAPIVVYCLRRYLSLTVDPRPSSRRREGVQTQNGSLSGKPTALSVMAHSLFFLAGHHRHSLGGSSASFPGLRALPDQMPLWRRSSIHRGHCPAIGFSVLLESLHILCRGSRFRLRLRSSRMILPISTFRARA